MQPRFEILERKLLVGKRIQTSFTENRTTELWKSFMPSRKEISNPVSPSLYSVENYDAGFFEQFDPSRKFEKWAAMEVVDDSHIPDGMEYLELPRGLYAVFIHKGPASTGSTTYEFIFREWLPGSDYIPDHRPHFALMDERYKHEDPSSEEEIWIPVRSKL